VWRGLIRHCWLFGRACGEGVGCGIWFLWAGRAWGRGGWEGRGCCASCGGWWWGIGGGEPWRGGDGALHSAGVGGVGSRWVLSGACRRLASVAGGGGGGYSQGLVSASGGGGLIGVGPRWGRGGGVGGMGCMGWSTGQVGERCGARPSGARVGVGGVVGGVDRRYCGGSCLRSKAVGGVLRG